jgi:SAM-dependent methyltransferase
MSEADRRRWDDRYRQGPTPDDAIALPDLFVPHEGLFPRRGRALDLACGRGRATLWLAARGLEAWGVDISPVAIAAARELADRRGLADRCRFDVVDLDAGLPEGFDVDVVLCHLFKDAALDGPIVERLTAGGLLAIAVLSASRGREGPYRSSLRELVDGFPTLSVVASGDDGETAWFLGRKPSDPG